MCYWTKIASQFAWIGRLVVLGKVYRKDILSSTHFGNMLWNKITRAEYSKALATITVYKICTAYVGSVLCILIFRLQAVGFLKVSRCHHSNMYLVNSKSGSVRENDVEVIEDKT